MHRIIISTSIIFIIIITIIFLHPLPYVRLRTILTHTNVKVFFFPFRIQDTYFNMREYDTTLYANVDDLSMEWTKTIS